MASDSAERSVRAIRLFNSKITDRGSLEGGHDGSGAEHFAQIAAECANVRAAAAFDFELTTLGTRTVAA